MNQDLRGYEYLWDGTEPGWVLLRSMGIDDAGAHLVVNKNRNILLLIEDSSEHQLVCERLLSLGVEVLDEMPNKDFIWPEPDSDGMITL